MAQRVISSEDSPEAGFEDGEAMSPSQTREVGRVKWFDVVKGYGFIACAQGEDVFVHWHALGKHRLYENDVVEFTVTKNKRGWEAKEVIILAKA